MSRLINTLETDPLFQGWTRSWDEVRGNEVTGIWLGTETGCRAMESTQRNDGATSSVVERDGDSQDWRLTVTFPFDPDDPSQEGETLVNTFELLGNEIEQEIIANPVLIAAAEAVGGSEIELWDVYDIWKRYDSRDLTYADAKTAVQDINVGAYSVYSEFFHDLIHGLDGFFNFHYVFRRTYTVTDPSQYKAEFVGVNQVWTEAQVKDHEFSGPNYDPDNIYFVLPEGYQWLKKSPTVTAAVNQRTQVTYEYWGATEWDSLYYAAYQTS